MEESLRCWLRSTYEEVIDDDHESCEEESESDMIHSLGLYIFTMTDESSFQDVVEEISAHFGRDLTRFIQSSSTFLIEACLICAVSSLSADRTKFVQIIMRMEPAAKAFIMESLKNNLLHYFDPEQSVNETDHGTTPDDDRNALSDNHQSTTNRNTEALVVNGDPVGSSDVEKEDNTHNDKRVISFCLSCNDNAIRRAALQEDIESIIRREKEGEIKLRAEITSQTNRLIDAEITIIDMDAKLASKSSELDSALSIIQENEAKIRGCNKVIGQFQLIQDEIDVLKPKADRAEASEQQLEKLRNKLDELKGIKGQLKAESAAHTDTHASLVATTQELDSLKRVKVQLDEYRSQSAESAIQIEELTARLAQREQEIRKLELNCEDLRGGQQGQRLEAQHLSQELNALNDQLRNDRTGGDGVGLGMSELNPALMNELHKLRTDNSDLLKKIDASSIDSLNLMESQIADQKCINTSLQGKWMAAKDSLAQTQNVVLCLNSQLANLKSEYASFQNLSNEIQGMMREDHLSTRYESEVELLHLKTTFEDMITALHSENVAAIGVITNKLSKTEEILKTKLENLFQVENEKESVMVNLSFTEQELKEEKLMRAQDDVAAKLLLESLREEKRCELGALRGEGQERMQLLIDHHEVNLAAEIERARDAAAEVDIERIKRRKVDREKKYFEAETHRLKTLLSVSAGGGASGQDIEEALKEMKSMQILLNEANTKIQVLRSQGTLDGNHRFESSHDVVTETAGPRTGVRGGAVRPQRVLGSDTNYSSSLGNSIAHTGGTGQMGGTYGGYLEQTDMVDKRVEQLTREKRDLLSKNLEENKERVEVSQKLIASEKEIRTLKSKITKMTLEKERAERRVANMAAPDLTHSDESPTKKIKLRSSRIEEKENKENI